MHDGQFIYPVEVYIVVTDLFGIGPHGQFCLPTMGQEETESDEERPWGQGQSTPVSGFSDLSASDGGGGLGGRYGTGAGPSSLDGSLPLDSDAPVAYPDGDGAYGDDRTHDGDDGDDGDAGTSSSAGGHGGDGGASPAGAAAC